MSEIKRYNAKLASYGGQYRVVVLASDYAALRVEVERLQRELATAHNDASHCAGVASELRAEVEALRDLLAECRPSIQREVEKWTRASAFMPVNAGKESALLARIDAAMEASQ